MKIIRFLKENWMLVAAILYLLFPVDIIPDVFPVLGYSDDALILILTLLIRFLKFRKKPDSKVIEGGIVE